MTKPGPKIENDSRPYWDACNRGKLVYQACNKCGNHQLYFRSACRECHSTDLAVKESSGKGTIQSYTLVFRAPYPSFQADLPYFLALIDLNEGARIMTNILDADPAKMKIGAAVSVVFEDRSGQKIPQFKLDA